MKVSTFTAFCEVLFKILVAFDVIVLFEFCARCFTKACSHVKMHLPFFPLKRKETEVQRSKRDEEMFGAFLFSSLVERLH